jgi:hypothetical protein
MEDRSAEAWHAATLGLVALWSTGAPFWPNQKR